MITQPTGIAIVYPAIYSCSTPSAHCTAIFLGEVGQVEFTKDQLVEAVYDLSPFWPRRVARHIDVDGIEWFGKEHDKPVMTLESELLMHMRSLLDERLAEDQIRSASEFDYRPHITVDRVPHPLPKSVLLAAPTVWWGNER